MASDHAIAQHPYATSLKLKRAAALIPGGRFDEALELLAFLKEVESNNVEIYYLAGTIYTLTDRFKTAEKVFDMALEFAEEEQDELLFNMGIMPSNNYVSIKLAEKYFTLGYKTNPTNDSIIF